jgi:hypothetical protein
MDKKMRCKKMKRKYVEPSIEMYVVVLEGGIAQASYVAPPEITPWEEGGIIGDAANNAEGGDIYLEW